jgi:hypothetical protein
MLYEMNQTPMAIPPSPRCLIRDTSDYGPAKGGGSGKRDPPFLIREKRESRRKGSGGAVQRESHCDDEGEPLE